MKTWFITGASRGFGRIWAEAALQRGDQVTATARKLEDIVDLKERFGDAVLPIALDVTNSEQVSEAVQQAFKHFGRLDILVNNAGRAFSRLQRRRATNRSVTCSTRTTSGWFGFCDRLCLFCGSKGAGTSSVCRAVLGLRRCRLSASTAPQNGQWKLFTNRSRRR